MEVKIITQYGENVFDLDEKAFSEIIQNAIEHASKARMQEEAVLKQESVDMSKICESSAPKYPHGRSRVDTLFGAGWREEAGKTAEKNADPEVAELYYADKQQEGYKGFLLVKCEKCGKIKGFCSKHSLRYYECECGHRTELEDMKPLHLHCKCGSSYTYLTNVQDAEISYDCLNCGSPVDLELNGRRNAYVTIGGGVPEELVIVGIPILQGSTVCLFTVEAGIRRNLPERSEKKYELLFGKK